MSYASDYVNINDDKEEYVNADDIIRARCKADPRCEYYNQDDIPPSTVAPPPPVRRTGCTLVGVAGNGIQKRQSTNSNRSSGFYSGGSMASATGNVSNTNQMSSGNQLTSSTINKVEYFLDTVDYEDEDYEDVEALHNSPVTKVKPLPDIPVQQPVSSSAPRTGRSVGDELPNTTHILQTKNGLRPTNLNLKQASPALENRGEHIEEVSTSNSFAIFSVQRKLNPSPVNQKPTPPTLPKSSSPFSTSVGFHFKPPWSPLSSEQFNSPQKQAGNPHQTHAPSRTPVGTSLAPKNDAFRVVLHQNKAASQLPGGSTAGVVESLPQNNRSWSDPSATPSGPRCRVGVSPMQTSKTISDDKPLDAGGRGSKPPIEPPTLKSPSNLLLPGVKLSPPIQPSDPVWQRPPLATNALPNARNCHVNTKPIGVPIPWNKTTASGRVKEGNAGQNTVGLVSTPGRSVIAEKPQPNSEELSHNFSDTSSGRAGFTAWRNITSPTASNPHQTHAPSRTPVGTSLAPKNDAFRVVLHQNKAASQLPGGSTAGVVESLPQNNRSWSDPSATPSGPRCRVGVSPMQTSKTISDDKPLDAGGRGSKPPIEPPTLKSPSNLLLPGVKLSPPVQPSDPVWQRPPLATNALPNARNCHVNTKPIGVPIPWNKTTASGRVKEGNPGQNTVGLISTPERGIIAEELQSNYEELSPEISDTNSRRAGFDARKNITSPRGGDIKMPFRQEKQEKASKDAISPSQPPPPPRLPPRHDANSSSMSSHPSRQPVVEVTVAAEYEILPETFGGYALSKYDWYFGELDRNRSEALLKPMQKKDGSFLVRKRVTDDDNAPYCISVACSKRFFQVLIRQLPGNRFAVGYVKPNEKVFSSVPELINYYKSNTMSLTDDTQLLLLGGSPPKK